LFLIKVPENQDEIIELLKKRKAERNQRKEVEDEEEEEEQLFTAEEEKRYGSRKYVSRNQWIRYMMKLDGSKGKKWNEQTHWLWWGRKLAQFFVLSINNRISTEKVLWKKSKQKNLKQALPQKLVDALQKEFAHWFTKSIFLKKKILFIKIISNKIILISLLNNLN